MVMHHPLFILAVSFVLMWLAAGFGWLFINKKHPINEEIREDFGLILASTLTLLGLIIGFTFSMAASRYDQRKNYEEAEANAIGTEYLRADLLTPDSAEKIRSLLREYIDLRLSFFRLHHEHDLRPLNLRTAELQARLWTVVLAPAEAKPTPLSALAVAGMNDVLNSQGYTQAAYWNRIPNAAWALMFAVALVCNLLVGYGSHSSTIGYKLLPILPLIVAVAFMLIADLDSPQLGIIRVIPQNLISLAESLRPN